MFYSVNPYVLIPDHLVSSFRCAENMNPFLHVRDGNWSIEIRREDEHGLSAIQYAREVEILRFLVEAGVDYGRGHDKSIFCTCVRLELLDMAKYLIKVGIDSGDGFVLDSLCETSNEFLTLLIEAGLMINYSFVVRSSHDIGRMKILSDFGIDLTKFKGRGLIPVAGHGSSKVVKFLLGLGFDINETVQEYEYSFFTGATSLHFLAARMNICEHRINNLESMKEDKGSYFDAQSFIDDELENLTKLVSNYKKMIRLGVDPSVVIKTEIITFGEAFHYEGTAEGMLSENCRSMMRIPAKGAIS